MFLVQPIFHQQRAAATGSERPQVYNPGGGFLMQAVQLEQEARQQLVSILKDRLGDRLLALVLFGSRARRAAQVDSDWDVLAIATDLPESPGKQIGRASCRERV